MGTFKCENCGELNHESEKITNASLPFINKFVLLIALFVPGSGGKVSISGLYLHGSYPAINRTIYFWLS
jgi:hypothetical protein